jgi:hypothetical protein
MKIRLLITIAFLYISSFAFSQAGIPGPGKISMADLTSQECSFEKDAPAFYLLNYAKTDFSLYNTGLYKVTTERRVRIKIINQKGFEYATVLIPHLGSKANSKITNIEAFIYAAALMEPLQKQGLKKVIYSKALLVRLVS